LEIDVQFLKKPLFAQIAAGLALSLMSLGAQALGMNEQGAASSEIKIGNVAPYSGRKAPFGQAGRALKAYFDKVNAEGGINGKRITFLTYDSQSTPAETLAQTRRLVERDKVVAILGIVGTEENDAVHEYLNSEKIPHLFPISGASRWADPSHYPWTMGWVPSNQIEARSFVDHVLATKPRAKIAVLHLEGEFGRDYVDGTLDALGDKAKSMIVAKASFRTTDLTLDSQIEKLKASGADTFFDFTDRKHAVQVIRQVHAIGWNPTHYLASASTSVTGVLNPAGAENTAGIISATYLKDPSDSRWHVTKEYSNYAEWVKKYVPGADPVDATNVLSYSIGQTLVQVLKQAGNTPTRENIMHQAANLDLTLPMLFPRLAIRTSVNDFAPIKRLQIIRFDGKSWEPFGAVVGR
jgi:branched-chain amino acid transport system substrate-binding protein